MIRVDVVESIPGVFMRLIYVPDAEVLLVSVSSRGHYVHRVYTSIPDGSIAQALVRSHFGG